MNQYLKLLRVKVWRGFAAMVALGFIESGGMLQPPQSTILLAIAVAAYLGFGFTVNQYSDIEEDLLHGKDNPIAKGEISKKTASLVMAALAILGALASLSFGTTTLAYYVLLVIGGWIYSMKPVRMKSRPFLDVIEHGIVFGVMLFLFPFVSFGVVPDFSNYIMALSIFAVSGIMELVNHFRDYETDKQSGLKTTTCIIGKEWTLKLIKALALTFTLALYVIIRQKTLFLLLTALTLISLTKKMKWRVAMGYVALSYLLALTG